jgi:hypothetical protein
MTLSAMRVGAAALLTLSTPSAARSQSASPGLDLTRPIVSSLDRPCRSEDGEEIVVCARREVKRSPYRIPEPPDRFDPGGNQESVSRERHDLYEQGDTGIGSCSTVGPGGSTGCMLRQWKKDDQQWADHRPSLRNPGGGRNPE